jgi:hypothetical protein
VLAAVLTKMEVTTKRHGERRESRLAREVPMMTWGGVRSGCLLALSGGRRGRLQVKIFPKILS